METILEIKDLTKKFGKLTAVNNLNFQVEKGNVYGLLGPNGSGKSTTLGMILTTINPTSGSWTWFGNQFSTSQVLKKIGATIERPNFYPYLSAQKNLEIVAAIKETSKNNIEEALKLVGLYERKDDKFSTYSLGMKQRLAIAAAMLNHPEVLILDEPTNGLDPQGIIQIREIINNIAKKGTTIILASHLLDEVEKVCSHVIILRNGKSLYSGPVDAISEEGDVFSIKASDVDLLKKTLLDFPDFKILQEFKDGIEIATRENIEGDTLNKMFAEKGIYLKYLVKKKANLEEQFLELIKK